MSGMYKRPNSNASEQHNRKVVKPPNLHYYPNFLNSKTPHTYIFYYLRTINGRPAPQNKIRDKLGLSIV
jgi:hypothetical protein